jgi:hypothetical protein
VFGCLRISRPDYPVYAKGRNYPPGVQAIYPGMKFNFTIYSSLLKYGGEPHMEVIPKSTRRLTIRANWDIGVIEYTLKEHIGNCEIWD